MNQSNDAQAKVTGPDLFELVLKWEDFNERRQDFQYERGAFRQEEFVALMKETVSKVCAFRAKAFDFDNNTKYIEQQMSLG